MNRMTKTHAWRALALRSLLTAIATVHVVASARSQAGESERPEEKTPRIHSVCDISQDFTFYMDGRFFTQYLQGIAKDVRNWGSLHRLELDNVNLLVLTGGDPRIPYSEASLKHIEGYVAKGGTLVLLVERAKQRPPLVPLMQRFGASLAQAPCKQPLRACARLEGSAIEGKPRTTFNLDTSAGWTQLVVDADDQALLALRAFERGHVLLGARGLFGQRPDAKDDINRTWLRPLLEDLATKKRIDPDQPHRSTWAEHEKKLGALVLEYNDGTAPFAARIAKEYELVYPHLVAITGVDPAPGMLKRLLILPTGGGGFSSGDRIAIGAFWGDYPERRYPMVELIGHEAGHSWVLPSPEPLWNEPIATYLGIQVGKRLGMPDAERTLREQIDKGRKHDPDFSKVNPLTDGAARDLVWGKSYFVFEELERMHGKGALAKYFKTKRSLIQRGRKSYTMDDCVAVWSRAVGADLFPWFRSLAFDVDAARTTLR